MKRAVTSPQYVTCQVCENRIMAPLAKKGICPACHIADQGHGKGAAFSKIKGHHHQRSAVPGMDATQDSR